MKLFIDTSAFIALADKDDQHHHAAQEFFNSQISLNCRFLTSNFVVCETVTYLRIHVSYRAAVLFWENLHQSKRMEIHSISAELEEKAFRLLKRYNDKTFSFTDCTSFALMENLGMDAAFAFDDHFRQFGKWTIFPVAPR